jgi:hypothetical protein
MNNLLIKIKQFFSESEAIISDDCQEIYFRKKSDNNNFQSTK